jgi:hypothetical protein
MHEPGTDEIVESEPKPGQQSAQQQRVEDTGDAAHEDVNPTEHGQRQSTGLCWSVPAVEEISDEKPAASGKASIFDSVLNLGAPGFCFDQAHHSA